MEIEAKRATLKAMVISQMIDECYKHVRVDLDGWDEQNEILKLLDTTAGILMAACVRRISEEG